MSLASTVPAEIAEQAQITEREAALHKVLSRSAIDRPFRDALLADPLPALAEYGIVPPEGVRVRFIERTADMMLVLPDPLDEVMELSEDELLTVNGGAKSSSSAPPTTTTTTTSIGSLISGITLSVAVTVSLYLTLK